MKKRGKKVDYPTVGNNISHAENLTSTSAFVTLNSDVVPDFDPRGREQPLASRADLKRTVPIGGYENM